MEMTVCCCQPTPSCTEIHGLRPVWSIDYFLLELKLDPTTVFEWQKYSQDSTDVPHFSFLLELVTRQHKSSSCQHLSQLRNIGLKPWHTSTVSCPVLWPWWLQRLMTIVLCVMLASTLYVAVVNLDLYHTTKWCHFWSQRDCVWITSSLAVLLKSGHPCSTVVSGRNPITLLHMGVSP